MKCGQCGTQNPGEARYCLACGVPLGAGSANPGPLRPLRPVIDRRVVAAENRLLALMPATNVFAQPIVARNEFRLILVHPDGTDGATYVVRGSQIEIGRTEGDLLFDDPYLSPRHARISAGPEGLVLTGLESRNGVFVRLQASVELEDGDLFLVGKQLLMFEILPDFEKDLRPAVQNNVILFGSHGKPAWGRLRQMGPTGVSHDVFHFGRDQVVIGREQGDIVFSDDQFMSRRHAQLSLRGRAGQLEDLGSSNGTFIRLRQVPHPLAPGDIIRLGNVLLRFEHV
jgi:pSer/pThr/pTyr-binding forkhead associated (FHA) protein